jgi:hypothetical protein
VRRCQPKAKHEGTGTENEKGNENGNENENERIIREEDAKEPPEL